MFLGRIIANSTLIDTLDFVDKVKQFDDFQDGVPTIIIGKKLAESIYGKENIKVLNRKISDNVYWTFAKNEQRKDYENDIKLFNQRIIKTMKKEIKYEFFNVLTEPLHRVKGFITFMKGKYRKVIYVTDDQMYIYHNKIVYGISFNDLEYIGIGRNKVLEKISANPYNTIIDNNVFLSEKMKTYIGNDEILVPYLYFLQKER